jgi:hypothetical protein
VSPCLPARAEEQLGPNDIICGRDFASQAHAGNQAFRRIIRAFWGRYQAATVRTEKVRIVKSVALAVKRKGGRFVVPHKRSGAWREAEENVGLEKIRQALNSRRHSELAWQRTADPSHAQEEDAAYHDLLTAQRAMFSNLLEQEEG